jgi:hypothetical protein
MRYTGRRSIVIALAIMSIALNGCGSGNNEELPPRLTSASASVSVSVSGSGLLGIISGGIVTAFTPNDRVVLAESVTQVDGTFDLDISLLHKGPILIEITPSADGSSTFLCDFPGGCPNPDNADALISFGGNVPFDLTLSSAITDIIRANDVSINPITTAVVARAAELGGITEVNLGQANNEMSRQLSLLLGEDFPTDISAVPNINLVAPQTIATHPLIKAGVLLAFLNSGLISLINDDETLEDVILDLADGFAPDGTLGANSNFNVDELGSTELLFATQQTISGAIATQPTIAQKLEEIVPSLNLSQTNTTLQMRRNEIAAIPPTILGVPEAIALEDAPYSFTPIVTDEDDTSFSFSVTNLPSWASFNNSDGTISGVPVNANAGDTDQTSISVSDGFSTSTLGPFTITVKNTNDAPIITGTPQTYIAESALYQFTPSASDVDAGSALNYSISPATLPGWLTFNSQTGELSGTPQDADVGITPDIIISVSDGEIDTSLAPFSIKVTNIPPSISGVPNAALEDSTFIFTPISVGGNNFSVTNLPDWATFDSNMGSISGTPLNANVGVYRNINISLSDLNETVVLSELSIEVINTNDAPQINGTPPTGVQEDAVYSFTPFATDEDVGDTLTYKIFSKPKWASFSLSTGTLTGTPDNDDVAIYSDIVISVFDTANDIAQIDAFSIEVTNTNDAPTIVGVPPTEVLEGSLYSFIPLAKDVDIAYGDEISLTLTLDQAKPDWLSFDGITGALSGSPTDTDVGVLTNLVVTVTDGEETTRLPAFDVTITNIPPTINGSLQDATEDVKYSSKLTASGGNSFAATNLPTWASINPATGEITGTPLNDDVGTTTNISVQLSDANETVTLSNLSLAVININDIPTLSGIPPNFAFVDTPYSFPISAEDVDAGSFINFTDNLPSWATLDVTDPTTPTVMGTPTTSDIAVTEIIVTASDSIEPTPTELSFTLEVLHGHIVYLAWDNPVENTDGSPLSLSSLYGYEIIYALAGEQVTTDRVVTGPGGATIWTSPKLAIGTYTFSVKVFNEAGQDSSESASLRTNLNTAGAQLN